MNKGPRTPGSKHWREQQAGDLVGALFPQDFTSNSFHTRLTGGQKQRACGEGHLWPLLIRSAPHRPAEGARGWTTRSKWPYRTESESPDPTDLWEVWWLPWSNVLWPRKKMGCSLNQPRTSPSSLRLRSCLCSLTATYCGDFDGLGYDSIYNFEIRTPRVKNKGH